MAINVTLAQLSTLNNQSILGQTNANNAIIQAALPDALSRSGASPNQMGSNLDMNNNQILNLPAPASINSPARLVDVTAPATIASVPPVGTSGAVVGLLNTNNTVSGNNTFSGSNTFSNTNTFTNNNTFSGTNTFTTLPSLPLTALLGQFAITGAGNLYGAQGSFWTDVTNTDGTNNARIHQFRDRLFVDDGALNAGSWNAGSGSLSNSRSGTAINSVNWNWAPREASILGISSWGEMSIVGMSVSSSALRSGDPNPIANVSPIGVAGFGLNDRTTNIGSTWAGYFESLRKTAAVGTSITVELDTGNVGSVVDITPFSQPTGMTVGLWNQAGGSAGGAVTYTNPSAGIAFGSNGAKWRKGIVFTNSGLDTALGSGTGGLAIEFGDGQSYRWLNVSNQVIGEVWSTSTGSGTLVLQPRTNLQINGNGTWFGNGSVATSLGSNGPTGSHTSPQAWLVVIDNQGLTRYIPAF
jgi:hypothetical protein